MNVLRHATSLSDEIPGGLEVSPAFRQQGFTIDLKVGPGRLHGIWRQGSSPLETGIIASNDMRAF